MPRLADRMGIRARRFASDLPGPAKTAAQLALSAVDPLRRSRHRRRTGSDQPIPPVALRARAGSIDIDAFLSGGSQRYLDQGLAEAGRPLESFESVLDLGCGSGRTLVPLARRTPAATTLHGCDIDAEAIAWLREHHPELELEVSKFDPPLPYHDQALDLVYSISVFTHLDEPGQFAWLHEVRRVLRPGGLALLTIHGESLYGKFSRGEVVGAIRSAPARIASHGSLAEAGFVYESAEPSRWNALRFMDRSDGWGLAFHSEKYVNDNWTEVFPSVRVLEGPSQDIVLASG